MAILEEQFTETLDAGATPIKYEGDVERQREVAEKLWAQLNPQQQMEFGSFEQFFSSGAWKKVLELMMQQQRGEGQAVMEGEGAGIMEQGVGMQTPPLPPTPSPMVNPGAGAAAPGPAGGMGQGPIMPQPRATMARGGIAELFEEEEIEEPGFDEIEEEEVVEGPKGKFREMLERAATASFGDARGSRKAMMGMMGAKDTMQPMRGNVNVPYFPRPGTSRMDIGGGLPEALPSAQIRTGTGGAPVRRPRMASHDPGGASDEGWFSLWQSHPMGHMFPTLIEFKSWYLDNTDYDQERMAVGGRIGFGLGRFVKKAFKKATRAVKKVAKSPIGKAALMYAATAGLGSLGAGSARAGSGMFGWLNPSNVAANLGTSWTRFAPQALKGTGNQYSPFLEAGYNKNLSTLNPTTSGNILTRIGKGLSKFPGGIGGAALTAGMAAPFLFPNLGKPEEVKDLRSQSPDIDLDDIRGRVQAAYQEGPDAVAALQQEFPYLLPYGSANVAEGGRVGAQEGGLMDLGGMEKDYRQEGGFVPLGGEEKADDVPARLSKNEFVFTADAVRSAGGGDIDAGAEVMENVMNNLEQGGQISEESQGLKGARDMFAVSERLSEVV